AVEDASKRPVGQHADELRLRIGGRQGEVETRLQLTPKVTVGGGTAEPQCEAERQVDDQAAGQQEPTHRQAARAPVAADRLMDRMGRSYSRAVAVAGCATGDLRPAIWFYTATRAAAPGVYERAHDPGLGLPAVVVRPSHVDDPGGRPRLPRTALADRSRRATGNRRASGGSHRAISMRAADAGPPSPR